MNQTTFSLVHARLVTPRGIVEDATVTVQEAVITGIGDIEPVGRTIDCTSLTVGPSMIDMHIHGAGLCSPTPGEDVGRSLRGMCSFLSSQGVASIQLAISYDPTLLSLIAEALAGDALLRDFIAGVYIEGPFINAQKRGGIPLQSIHEPDPALLRQILEVQVAGKPLVTAMVVAPELAGIGPIADMLREHNVLVAYGHSDALARDLDECESMHLTHLYNAMRGIDHKGPGLAILPFLDSDCTYELICDQTHVDPLVLQMTIDALGTDNMCIISDGSPHCGMGVGGGLLQGKRYTSDGRTCRFEDGVLIGSCMGIWESSRLLHDASLLTTSEVFQVTATNPARVLGLTDRGSIEVGKKGHFFLADNTLRHVGTIRGYVEQDS